MTWTPKRFWKTTSTAPTPGGWQVLLDTRTVKTPAKSALVLPSEGLAELVAAEWEAQQGQIDPNAMPVTRMANSAIDKVTPMQAEVVAHLAEYGGSDLLCYRAERPEALVRRQAAAWDPLLDWIAAEGAPLRQTTGVIHIAQDPASLARLTAMVAALTPFQLAAFHDLVAISGSLVLALAVAKGHLGPQEAWERARIDETFQAEEWGEDEEATEIAARKRADFLMAAQVFALAG